MVIQRYSIELISAFFFYTFAMSKRRNDEWRVKNSLPRAFDILSFEWDIGNISINILKERIYYDWVFCIFDDQLPQAWGRG